MMMVCQWKPSDFSAEKRTRAPCIAKCVCKGVFHPLLDLPRRQRNCLIFYFIFMKKQSKKGACSANVQPAKANCLKHDRREGKIPSYVNPHLTHTNRVVFEAEDIRERKSIMPLKRQREKLYTEKTHQKCQKKFTPFREDVLRLKEGITDQQLLQFKQEVEKLTGWRVMGIYLHQDEGHAKSKYIEGDEGFAINYHAHVLYDCQDPVTGKALRVQRDIRRKCQDLLAQCTGMERGTPASETGRMHRSSMQQRVLAQEERIEELKGIVDDLQKQVGRGAQIASFFGVGPRAKIRRELEEAKEREAQAENDKKAAEKALQDAKEAHTDELATEKEKSRQSGYKEAISDVKKAANLHITGKDGKETAEDIGKAWRSEFNQRENLEQELQKARGKDQVWERSINRFLYHLGIDERITITSIEEANKMFDAGITQGRDWMRRGRWRLCKAICAWSVEYDNFLASPSQKALQSLLGWYRTMKEAWEALLSQARMILQLSTSQNDLMKMVNRQLNFTPIPGVEYINDWKGALDMGEEKYLTSLQKNVEEEGKRKEFMKQQEEYRKQQEEDEGIEEEETQSRGWHV